ncbi:MAG TPA: AraC family transcriptional regulator, partial [Kineosporiaceae bacterium]|nr:AraC family transcriptional regulator [Kineosporiaceae bacterium]
EHDESRSSLLKAAAAGWSLLAELAADALAGTGTAVEPVHDAQEYLRMNLGKHIAVPALAARSGLSASHFSALFRRSTGGGVLEYVRRLRMARARELLVTTSWPIAQIAQAVGYQDAFYFSRQFRGVSGCSPSQYRQQADHEEGAGGPRTTLTAE